ncbi:MAG: MFS transporter [Chloroflexi bacterium]|nr:MFS transporter [Chloroflexota bacterium]
MIRRARIAIAVFFAANGFVFAGWVSRIPEVQDKLAMSEGTLGLVLLGMAIGLISALPLIGGVVSRYGSHRVTTVAGIVYSLVLPFLSIAPVPIVLFGILYSFGVMTGFMDISMNAQAVVAERLHGKSIMSSFHATFSIGGMIGAALSSGLIALGLSILPHLILMSVISALSLLYVSRFLLEDDPQPDQDKAPVFSLPSKALLPIGIIAACSTIGEGSMADWSAIYLSDTVNTSASLAAIGFAAYSLMMTIGRFFGDYLINRFKPVFMIRVGGAFAASGFTLAVLIPQPVPTIMGFCMIGIGLSTVIPIAFSHAGNMPNIPAGRGIAGVATLGYSGFLAGPPLIGLIADATSLRASFIVVAILLLGMASLAFTLRPKVATTRALQDAQAI